MNEITPANGALMSFIERAAKDPEFDVGKFGELLRLQRDVGHDQARRAFNAAMAEAQAEMLPVVRGAQNKHLGNKYARLEDIDREMRPIYTKHGFSVRYGSAPSPSEGTIRLTCTVAHAAGYFEENYLDAPLGNAGSQGGRSATTPVQSVGSAVTYLRRYLLGMVFNIVLADDDDDGEGTRRAAAATPRPPRKVDPTVYDAPAEKPQPQRKSWAQWADTLEVADRDASNDELGRLIARAEVAEIYRLAQEGERSPAKDRIVEAYRSIEERYLANPPEPDLSDEALGEVEIAGSEKIGAG